MSERNGPGGMKTERRSPMITSGVATPSAASSNIAVVITTAAHESGEQTGKDRFRFAHDVADLPPPFLSHKHCSVRCAQGIVAALSVPALRTAHATVLPPREFFVRAPQSWRM